MSEGASVIDTVEFKLPEDLKALRKIKREICVKKPKIESEDRISTGEYAGDFAYRYYVCSLFKRQQKRNKLISEST